jgi:hypothetical protein
MDCGFGSQTAESSLAFVTVHPAAVGAKLTIIKGMIRQLNLEVEE